MKRLAFRVAFLLGSFWGQVAAAAPSAADKELAKKLYAQGAEAMESGAYERACPQFEAALKLDPEHIRTAMTLGTCEQNWGKLARALTRLEYARSLAVAQSAADKLAEIDRMITSLRPKIPQLRIIVPEAMAATSGLLVTRNGAPVPTNEFGRLVFVDPGPYEITASAPNMPSSTQKLKLDVGQAMEVTLGVAIAATVVKNESMPQSSADRPIGRSLGFLGIGLGGAGLVAGAILGTLAITKNDASDQGHCDQENYCDAIGMQLRYDAQDYGNGSTVAFLAGGALLTAGIVLVATTPSSKTGTSSKGQTQIVFGLNQLGIRGTF